MQFNDELSAINTGVLPSPDTATRGETLVGEPRKSKNESGKKILCRIRWMERVKSFESKCDIIVRCLGEGLGI